MFTSVSHNSCTEGLHSMKHHTKIRRPIFDTNYAWIRISLTAILTNCVKYHQENMFTWHHWNREFLPRHANFVRCMLSETLVKHCNDALSMSFMMSVRKHQTVLNSFLNLNDKHVIDWQHVKNSWIFPFSFIPEARLRSYFKTSCIRFHQGFQTLENKKNTRPATLCFHQFWNPDETLALIFEIVSLFFMPQYFLKGNYTYISWNETLKEEGNEQFTG